MSIESKPSKGLAIASLILGVLATMCLGIVAGLPAIILGHTAYSRQRQAPERYGGGGMAIAGFVLGYCSLVTTLVLAGIFLPALAKAKHKAQSIRCINNLKSVGLAFRIYATDHDGRFPFHRSTNINQAASSDRADLETEEIRSLRTLSGLLANPKLLVCPADGSKRPAADFSVLGPENVSYELATGPEVNEKRPDEVLARCPVHGHELYVDGSVQ